MMALDSWAQVLIPIFSGAAIWALSGKHYTLGFTLGIISQPLWFYSTYTNELWGMFILSFWFTGNHIRGLYNHYDKKKTTPTT
jgi:nicotinamide riboside transporter PnuC